jgi:hypothetical protein
MKKLLLFIPLLAFSCGKYKTYELTITNNSGKPITVKSSEFEDLKMNNTDFEIIVLNKGEYSINVTSRFDNSINYTETIKVDNNTSYLTHK